MYFTDFTDNMIYFLSYNLYAYNIDTFLKY